MDNAHSAEKMYAWDNMGGNNSAWKTCPYISAGANCEQINRNQPYFLRVSESFSDVLGYQSGPNPPINEKNGGVALGHRDDRIESTILIPTVTICMQFALLEVFDYDLFDSYKVKNQISDENKYVRRYRRLPVKERMEAINSFSKKTIPKKIINAYVSVSNFRNLLIHEPKLFCKDAFWAMDVYWVCQAIAFSLNKSIGVPEKIKKIEHRIPLWKKRIKFFNEVIKYEDLGDEPKMHERP